MTTLEESAVTTSTVQLLDPRPRARLHRDRAATAKIAVATATATGTVGTHAYLREVRIIAKDEERAGEVRVRRRRVRPNLQRDLGLVRGRQQRDLVQQDAALCLAGREGDVCAGSDERVAEGDNCRGVWRRESLPAGGQPLNPEFRASDAGQRIQTRHGIHKVRSGRLHRRQRGGDAVWIGVDANPRFGVCAASGEQ